MEFSFRNNYWDSETPIVITTKKNVFRFFEKSGKLQVSQSSWRNREGIEMQGKTVTIDIASLLESPGAVNIFKTIIN